MCTNEYDKTNISRLSSIHVVSEEILKQKITSKVYFLYSVWYWVKRKIQTLYVWKLKNKNYIYNSLFYKYNNNNGHFTIL